MHKFLKLSHLDELIPFHYEMILFPSILFALKSTDVNTATPSFFFFFVSQLFFKFIFIDFKERKRKGVVRGERHQFVVPLIYAFIG